MNLLQEKLQNKITTNPPVFKLGDNVISKYTGLVQIGIIIGIDIASLYLARSPQSDYAVWDGLFPDWRHKYMYVVHFDEPSPTLSIDEFNKYKNEGKYPNDYKYENLPKFKCAAYCEDDLELL